MRQTPRLMRSEMTGEVYIVTKYESLGEGNYRAKEKFDVTKEFELMAIKYMQSKDIKENDENTPEKR